MSVGVMGKGGGVETGEGKRQKVALKREPGTFLFFSVPFFLCIMQACAQVSLVFIVFIFRFACDDITRPARLAYATLSSTKRTLVARQARF